MSILTDGYHIACSTQQNPCLFNKSSCMHCNANMMYTFTSYFVLTLTTLCAAPNKLCHVDKLSCIYCHAHMIYMYTYFVLTSINLICSRFIHLQQHAQPQIVGTGHPCYNMSLFFITRSEDIMAYYIFHVI